MTGDDVSVSVIICTYTEERWDDLVTAVTSAHAQTSPPCEVIIVVDHNPALFDRVRSSIANVTAVENEDTRGLSGSRNSGIRAADGDIVVFLDDDAWAEPDWLEHLVSNYDDRRVLGVGGTVAPVWHGERPALFPPEFYWIVGATYTGVREDRGPIRNMFGGNMSFRRKVFVDVGGFRTGIGRAGVQPMGCEETELCIRVRDRWPDGELLYEPAAKIHHQVPVSRQRWRYFVSRCYAEGLSKAIVTRFTGRRSGLSSERAYALRTLPRGIVRGLTDALRGDVCGLGRAAAIVVGLLVTTFAYTTESARLAVASHDRRVGTADAPPILFPASGQIDDL